MFKELAERMKSISQERDELRNRVGVCEIQLKATSEEKAVTDREFIDSKEEVQSVKNQLLELKENLQVEQKEKEVSKRSKMSPSSLHSLTHRSITIGEGSHMKTESVEGAFLTLVACLNSREFKVPLTPKIFFHINKHSLLPCETFLALDFFLLMLYYFFQVRKLTENNRTSRGVRFFDVVCQTKT